MAEMYMNQLLDEELILEEVKQVTLDTYYSFFINRDISKLAHHLKEDVCWFSGKGNISVKSRKEVLALMSEKLKEIPSNCILKVVAIQANRIGEDSFSACGELEIRIPYKAELIYISLRFIMNMVKIKGHLLICNVFDFLNNQRNLELKAQSQKSSGNTKDSRYDSLTGFYTLEYFKDTLRLFLDQVKVNGGYALLYTDISNFEKLNNLYGLQQADRVLVGLSKLLMKINRKVICGCRSVADHFLLLIEADSEMAIRRDVTRLCKEFDVGIGNRLPDAVLKLGIGVYIISNYTISVDRMVELANVARKSLRFLNSSHIAFYDPKLYQHAETIKRIERQMEKALTDGEFKVFLQPKYNLVTGSIVGAEALIRWIRPDGSMVYPDEFIPVFEKNGFIRQIDFFVLGETCRMLKRRLSEHKRCVPISVNQSRVLLKNKDYTMQIANVLEEYNTPPELIELELTERLFSDKLGDMAIMMHELKDIGIRWSIDDFGTGYSSLNLLKELPVDIIKIDKAFLDETETSEVSRLIIRKTVELTRELKKLVVCEGVETEEQADYLRTIHCDIAQGFLYARPMAMNDFEKMLDQESDDFQPVTG